ncbi:Coiled-Coil Domain-Containing Protein 83 [Manis pentadactyla]|nr:Coiled-Coil Domain-Containing Protein 83 [Manis pentadactyla]
MLVSSSSALGIKTCLYKGFLTAKGTKCSPERKEPESLHLPSTPALKTKQCLPKELAAGPWQVVETALQLAQKEKTQTFSFGEQRDYSAHHLLKEKGPPCQPTKLSFYVLTWTPNIRFREAQRPVSA